MSPDNWAKVSEIFAEALAATASERRALIAHRCAGDPEMLETVESLLASHEEAEATASGRWRAQTALTEPVEVKGRIGPYQVIGLIGKGGMAEVFRVRDERMGREVAFKILLPEYADDEEYLERFRREVRAVSVLEHPNICRLYDTGEWQGRPFLTMELLEGQTLRQRMNTGPLPFEEIEQIAISVAAGMAAAHGRGFLHRDTKPANIFLTSAGEIKILDFGLAKRMPTAHRTAEDTLTNRASTPGTPAYMAPEQILGGESDARSDTYALGVVLYEMVTGRTPYDGVNATDLFRKALKEPITPPSAIRPDTPKDLERIILRALERDRDLRYQSALDLRAELRRLRRVAPPPVETPPKSTRRWWIGLASITAAAGAVAWFRKPQLPPSPQLRVIDAVMGVKDSPVVSPSGDRMAYSIIDTKKRVVVTQLETGATLRVSKHADAESMPVWSPDGTHLAFRRGGTVAPGFYIAPVLGGGELKVADVMAREPQLIGGRNLDWGPGAGLAFVDRASEGGPLAIFTVNERTRERRVLLESKGFIAMPAFSPDGQSLAYVQGEGPRSADIYVVPASGGQPRRITHDSRWIGGISWRGPHHLLWSSNRLGLFQLWQQGLTQSAPELVPGTGGDAFSPSVSRDGRTLAYVHRRLAINLFLQGKRVTNSSRANVDAEISPDGKRLVYASDRSGHWEIWVTDLDSGQDLRITSMQAGQSGSPRWSSDGRLIYFVSDRGGVPQIWRVAMGGGEAMPAVNESIFRMAEPTGQRLAQGYWPMPRLEGGPARTVEIEERVELADSEIYLVTLPG